MKNQVYRVHLGCLRYAVMLSYNGEIIELDTDLSRAESLNLIIQYRARLRL